MSELLSNRVRVRCTIFLVKTIGVTTIGISTRSGCDALQLRSLGPPGLTSPRYAVAISNWRTRHCSKLASGTRNTTDAVISAFPNGCDCCASDVTQLRSEFNSFSTKQDLRKWLEGGVITPSPISSPHTPGIAGLPKSSTSSLLSAWSSQKIKKFACQKPIILACASVPDSMYSFPAFSARRPLRMLRFFSAHVSVSPPCLGQTCFRHLTFYGLIDARLFTLAPRACMSHVFPTSLNNCFSSVPEH